MRFKNSYKLNESHNRGLKTELNQIKEGINDLKDSIYRLNLEVEDSFDKGIVDGIYDSFYNFVRDFENKFNEYDEHIYEWEDDIDKDNDYLLWRNGYR